MAGGINIRPVVSADYGELLTLQRAAFVDEARLYDTPFVPALDESLDAMRVRLDESTSWAAIEGARIVGAVSVRSYRGSPDIERLMVAPDRRGQGISARLLTTAEDHAREQGHTELQLIVGERAENNRSIYAHLGWIERGTHVLEGFEHVVLRSMTKAL